MDDREGVGDEATRLEPAVPQETVEIEGEVVASLDQGTTEEANFQAEIAAPPGDSETDAGHPAEPISTLPAEPTETAKEGETKDRQQDQFPEMETLEAQGSSPTPLGSLESYGVDYMPFEQEPSRGEAPPPDPDAQLPQGDHPGQALEPPRKESRPPPLPPFPIHPETKQEDQDQDLQAIQQLEELRRKAQEEQQSLDLKKIEAASVVLHAKVQETIQQKDATELDQLQRLLFTQTPLSQPYDALIAALTSKQAKYLKMYYPEILPLSPTQPPPSLYNLTKPLFRKFTSLLLRLVSLNMLLPEVFEDFNRYIVLRFTKVNYFVIYEVPYTELIIMSCLIHRCLIKKYSSWEVVSAYLSTPPTEPPPLLPEIEGLRGVVLQRLKLLLWSEMRGVRKATGKIVERFRIPVELPKLMSLGIDSIMEKDLQDVVLVLGQSRVGKSTLVDYLSDHKEDVPVGHVFPRVKKTHRGIVFIDCPGVLSNYLSDYDHCSSLINSLVISMVKKIRTIILTVDYNVFCRFDSTYFVYSPLHEIRNIFRTSLLYELFKDPNILTDETHFILVITKAPDSFDSTSHFNNIIRTIEQNLYAKVHIKLKLRQDLVKVNADIEEFTRLNQGLDKILNPKGNTSSQDLKQYMNEWRKTLPESQKDVIEGSFKHGSKTRLKTLQPLTFKYKAELDKLNSTKRSIEEQLVEFDDIEGILHLLLKFHKEQTIFIMKHHEDEDGNKELILNLIERFKSENSFIDKKHFSFTFDEHSYRKINDWMDRNITLYSTQMENLISKSSIFERKALEYEKLVSKYKQQMEDFIGENVLLIEQKNIDDRIRSMNIVLKKLEYDINNLEGEKSKILSQIKEIENDKNPYPYLMDYQKTNKIYKFNFPSIPLTGVELSCVVDEAGKLVFSQNATLLPKTYLKESQYISDTIARSEDLQYSRRVTIIAFKKDGLTQTGTFPEVVDQKAIYRPNTTGSGTFGALYFTQRAYIPEENLEQKKRLAKSKDQEIKYYMDQRDTQYQEMIDIENNLKLNSLDPQKLKLILESIYLLNYSKEAFLEEYLPDLKDHPSVYLRDSDFIEKLANLEECHQQFLISFDPNITLQEFRTILGAAPNTIPEKYSEIDLYRIQNEKIMECLYFCHKRKNITLKDLHTLFILNFEEIPAYFNQRSIRDLQINREYYQKVFEKRKLSIQQEKNVCEREFRFALENFKNQQKIILMTLRSFVTVIADFNTITAGQKLDIDHNKIQIFISNYEKCSYILDSAIASNNKIEL
eukprot:TRINITY_DN16057_c0_g1_i1.p1 TRINITY_DN16057_c0_g1~~TRINITY_DN16057_c0_g1_i1.p1  ORF type:complete len:1281 (-),score=414.49 TRINITY_DN16057_c0_g1_i1:17-3805(-)